MELLPDDSPINKSPRFLWAYQEMSLEQYFDIVPPPSASGDTISLWKIVLDLVDEVRCFHSSTFEEIHGQTTFEGVNRLQW